MPPAAVYLDANATTPPAAAVCTAMADALATTWGNPSSPHAPGRTARAALRRAREQTAALVGADPAHLTFTSGGSEAIAMWLHGVLARHLQNHGNDTLPTFWISGGEHPAVRAPLTAWAKAGRIQLLQVAADPLGRVAPADLAAALAAAPPRTAAGVALIAAHNETGAVQDIAALAAVAAEANVPLLLDGVQWTGKLPLNISTLPPLAWALAAHKFGGPKGVGALIAPPGVLAAPLIAGGPQEHRRRAGTENVPGIVGLGVAAELAAAQMAERHELWRQERTQLVHAIATAWPGATLISNPDTGLPQTLLFRFPGASGTELVQRLDLEGIAVSSGSACASGAVRASEALLGLGWSEAEAASCVRFSLPPYPQPHAAERVSQALARMAQDLGI